MIWNIDPVAFHLGPLQIRWYGIFFMLGLLIGAMQLPRALERRGYPKENANALTLWIPVGMLIGAHLVHLAFYEPRSFIENPRRIFELGLGLASHGGGLGCFVAAYFVTRKHKANFFRYIDVILTGTVWVIPAVRIGNFFNSEIYGRVTDVPWGVVFTRRGFTEPRHPSQLYEAGIGIVLLLLTRWLDKHKASRLRDGSMTFAVLGLYFLSRFAIEWVKEYQVLNPSFPFTMGQLLSIPFILLFGYLALFSKRFNVLQPRTEPLVAYRAPEPANEEEVELADDSYQEDEPPREPARKKKRRKKRKGSAKTDAKTAATTDATATDEVTDESDAKQPPAAPPTDSLASKRLHANADAEEMEASTDVKGQAHVEDAAPAQKDDDDTQGGDASDGKNVNNANDDTREE